LPDDSFLHLGLLSICYLAIFLVTCALAGMNWHLLRTELTQARAMLARK
jgi:hypothetical protein